MVSEEAFMVILGEKEFWVFILYSSASIITSMLLYGTVWMCITNNVDGGTSN